ncbi:hypothetical protein HDU99_000504 [Rhizoclosmatium hyalinum]|nr:hypothetical protein HDU99_000504 [Rhizoclosmatium hyalinum]
MQVIADSYLAIVGLVVGKSGEQDLLSVWDTRFGTLQLKRVLNSDEAVTSTSDPLALTAKQPFFGRTYNIEPTHSSLSGPVLSISTSNLRSLPSDNTVSFNTSVSLYPFYCPPVSLLTAFGKLASSLKFSLEAGKEGTLAGLATVAQAPPHKTTALNNWFTGLTHLEDLDRTYVARITAATVTVDTMALELARWIYEKTTLTSPSTKLEKPTGDPHAINLTTMPIIEISQPAMTKLLTRALENPKTFYPTRVLQYLIRTGRVPACISVPDVSPVDPPRSISIIEQVLLQNDFQTLCLLLQDENGGCLGINEYDVLAIVQYVCCVPANEGEVGIMERRRNTIDVFVKSQVGSNKNAAYKKCLVKQDAGTEAVDTTGATTKMFDGRRWFFEKCFAIPQQNDFEFAKALKNLNVDQVGVVMAWVVGLLEVDVRLKTEVARKKTAVQKRKDLAAAAAAARASGSQKKKHLAIEAAAAVAEKFAFVDDMMERDLNQCLAENEVRRQLWWLWDTPGKKNEYSDAVCQAIDVINLIIDVHLTTILLTPSLHELVQRLKACINSDLHVFDMMQRKLNGCLSAFELSEVAKNKAAASVAGLSGDQKIAKKQEVVGTELRKRWKRMVAQVNDGVGTYAVEVMGI